MIDPGTAMLAGGAISALGGLFGGGQGSQTKEQKREFNVGQAPGLARMLQGAPLRDKLMAIMGNFASSPTQQFRPNDMFNPQQASLGAHSPESLLPPAGYKDGSGPMQAMLQQILGSMGYHQFDPQQPAQNPAAGGSNSGYGSLRPGPTPQTSYMNFGGVPGGVLYGVPARK